jgi:hypothetical protein
MMLPQLPQLYKKWQPFSFIFNWGNRKIVWVGDDSYVVFSQKFPGEKRSAKQCAVMIEQPVLLSPKFGGKFFNVFTQLPYNVTVVCGIDPLACHDVFFVNNTIDVKESDDHASDFGLHLTCLFRPSPNACLIIVRVFVAFFFRDLHKI